MAVLKEATISYPPGVPQLLKVSEFAGELQFLAAARDLAQ